MLLAAAAGLLTLHIALPALELGAAIASAPADKKAYWGQVWMCCTRETGEGQKIKNSSVLYFCEGKHSSR